MSEPKGRVLVADDSRVLRTAVAGILRRAGFAVEQAQDGAAAISRVEHGGFDVVITDLSMPGLDGFQVLEAIKHIAPGVEVIILTGAHADDMAAAVRAMRLGAHDYLTKPVRLPEQVVLTVERALEKRRLYETNRRLVQQLEEMSLTDALTGVGNRRAFEQALANEVARSPRHHHPLSLILLDIDHFKKINDTHGHAGGDEILRGFARVLTLGLREGDSVYRYGGEEFAVMLPLADATSAAITAERIVRAVASSVFTFGPHHVPVTTSAGVASLGALEDVAVTVARADGALYRAKEAGRNRVFQLD